MNNFPLGDFKEKKCGFIRTKKNIQYKSKPKEKGEKTLIFKNISN